MKLLFDENLSFRMYLSAILPKARMHYFHRSHGLRGFASCDALRHKPLERFQTAFPRRSAHRYTQGLEVCHFGRDAGIQRPRMANCGTQQMPLYPRTGNQGLASRLNQALAQPTGHRPWPGFRHPCRNDGFSGLAGLVYNDERRSVGTIEYID